MKNEWTEQDLRQFVESSRPVFQDVSLTQVDEDADRCWQDDGLMVDYELRGGQVDCVLRRCVVADGKVWQLQMTAPLAGNDLPEDRMTPREREMCRDDMNHDFVTGVFNRRYYETEFCTKLDEWTDCHRCAALALVSIDGAEKLSARESDAVMGQLVCFVANQWKKHFDQPAERVVCRLSDTLFAIGWAFAKPVIRWLLAMRKRQSAAEKAKAAQNAAKQRETVHTAPDGAGHTTTSTSTKES